MGGAWVKPPENSIEGLVHGITAFDGVEFDLRLTRDDVLVLFHDNHLSAAQREVLGGPKWTEDHSAAELAEVGIRPFSELLSEPRFIEAWREHGKVACVELKMPNPKSKVAGTVSPKKRERHARRMAKQVDGMLAEVELPHASVCLISFKRRFRRACARAGVRWPVAQLQPAIPEIGTRRMKRIMTLPSFMWLSMAFHLKHQQLVGAPMLPCAREYIDGFTRHLTLGRTVGLSGYTARRLNRLRSGFQAYVWPLPPRIEDPVRQLGLTGMTDNSTPELVTLPSGGARWTRWASQPLDEARETLLREAEPTHHAALLAEAEAEVTPWHELNEIERRGFLSLWRRRWGWDRDVEELSQDSGSDRMPWEVSRLIGHRGCGEDRRN